MGVYANAELMFGFINSTEEMNELFEAIINKAREEYVSSGGDISDFDEDNFTEFFEEQQGKYNVHLEAIGYDSDVFTIAAYKIAVSGKSINVRQVGSDKLEVTKSYEERIQKFFFELEIQGNYTPEWHLITYID